MERERGERGREDLDEVRLGTMERREDSGGTSEGCGGRGRLKKGGR